MLIEATPLVITIEDHYNTNTNINKSDDDPTTPPTATFINGLPDLWTLTNPPTNLDLNAGAEVHVVHDAPAHPDLRIITTVAEVYYRIVASKASSPPIRTPADLRGKRIGVVRNSTAEFFAYRYLREVAGLKEGEYTFVTGPPGGGSSSATPSPAGTVVSLRCSSGGRSMPWRRTNPQRRW